MAFLFSGAACSGSLMRSQRSAYSLAVIRNAAIAPSASQSNAGFGNAKAIAPNAKRKTT